MTATLTITRKFRIDTAPVIPMDYREARHAWLAARLAQGWKAEAPFLTPPAGNTKLNKNELRTYGLALAPHRQSGHNVCINSTPVCRIGCVSYAGRGSYSTVQEARNLRTRFLHECPEAAVGLMRGELIKAVRKYGSIAARLNTFSDLAWETMAPSLFDIDNVSFYDYTKRWDRETSAAYHLTYSRTERTPNDTVVEAIDSGRNVAVVFHTDRVKGPLPQEWLGIRVVDGDQDDSRFLDPAGVIVGLRAKGSMRRDTSGFAVAA